MFLYNRITNRKVSRRIRYVWDTTLIGRPYGISSHGISGVSGISAHNTLWRAWDDDPYAEKHCLHICVSYEDDEFPGTNTNRWGLKSRVDDCRSGAVQSVFVVNQDRLFRGRAKKWPFEVLSINPLERDLEHEKR
jgi:hypothetical protein